MGDEEQQIEKIDEVDQMDRAKLHGRPIHKENEDEREEEPPNEEDR